MPTVSMTWNQYAAWALSEVMEEVLTTPFDTGDYNEYSSDDIYPFAFGDRHLELPGPLNVLQYHGLDEELITVTSASVAITVASAGTRGDSIDITADGDLVAQVLETDDAASYSNAALEIPSYADDLESLGYSITITGLADSIEASKQSFDLDTYTVTVTYEAIASEFWTGFVGAEELA